jgi:hypothetical protein
MQTTHGQIFGQCAVTLLWLLEFSLILLAFRAAMLPQ